MTKFFVAAHALIEREGKYLVTRRSTKSTYMPLKWDIPGGIVESGETLEDAIYKEETGLTIKVENVVYIYANRDQLPLRQTFQIVYHCKYMNGEIRLNPSEHDMYQWLEYKDIANVEMIDFLRELVESYNPTTV